MENNQINKMELAKRIKSREAKICVIGLGYIGLPTACMFASKGFSVLGVDVKDDVIESLNNGIPHIKEPGLDLLVEAVIKSGKLRVADQPEPSDVYIIAVPTPITQDKCADMRFVDDATKSIVPHLASGDLVILESTSPPRTTIDRVAPILEQSGLRAGEDFMLAYSPERVLPGKILEELVNNSRIIGGLNPASGEAGRELYASFVDGEILLTDPTTAEMVKLMENTYRDVNIALANEFSLVAEKLGFDIWESIALANQHPRVNILNPGPGVGGHCIPVDPWFIAEVVPELTPLIQTARCVNDGMPHHVVERVKKAVSGIDKPIITCLGLTYKADVDDIRESPALKVVELLDSKGFIVRSYDPMVSKGAAKGQVGGLREAVNGSNVIVLLTDHSEFKRLSPNEISADGERILIDTRNLGF
jgi:UDP-N-acetyl-D-mannosaminuronic acid dehydrogenase